MRLGLGCLRRRRMRWLAPAHRPTAATRRSTPIEAAHHDAVAAQVQPFIDAEIATGIVVGLYDAGKPRSTASARAPAASRRRAHAVRARLDHEGLHVAAVRRRDPAPRGRARHAGRRAAAARRDRADARQAARSRSRELALHSSGLPRLPPSLARARELPIRTAGYDEDRLYARSRSTRSSIARAGHADRVLDLRRRPARVRARPQARRRLSRTRSRCASSSRSGCTTRSSRSRPAADGAPSVGHQRRSRAGRAVDVRRARRRGRAGLDRARSARADRRRARRRGGPTAARCARAMKLTQEAQLAISAGANEGLGWQIDSVGRYWHNGGTGGLPRVRRLRSEDRRGVVVLVVDAVSLVDHLARRSLQDPRRRAGHRRSTFPDRRAARAVRRVRTISAGSSSDRRSSDGERLYIDGGGAAAACGCPDLRSRVLGRVAAGDRGVRERRRQGRARSCSSSARSALAAHARRPTTDTVAGVGDVGEVVSSSQVCAHAVGS